MLEMNLSLFWAANVKTEILMVMWLSMSTIEKRNLLFKKKKCLRKFSLGPYVKIMYNDQWVASEKATLSVIFLLADFSHFKEMYKDI